MIESDARADAWIPNLPKDKRAVVVMEGVSMYFRIEELKKLLQELQGMERSVFKRVFGGGFAKKMYRLYEYKSR